MRFKVTGKVFLTKYDDRTVDVEKDIAELTCAEIEVDEIYTEVVSFHPMAHNDFYETSEQVLDEDAMKEKAYEFLRGEFMKEVEEAVSQLGLIIYDDDLYID